MSTSDKKATAKKQKRRLKRLKQQKERNKNEIKRQKQHNQKPRPPKPKKAKKDPQPVTKGAVANRLRSQRISFAPISAKLHALITKIEALTRPRDMPRRIKLCRQALTLLKRERSPEAWALLHVKLADSLQQNPLGARADNLEQAIHHYEQALKVRTRQATPSQWAATQNNLAIVYRNRIRGERADNLERAIKHYEQALTVRTRQATPSQWAMTQNNLGEAYRNRIRGERADNLEQAIAHFQQALEVRTRQATPSKWAETQNNLANALLSRIRGERADNLERAIKHYEQALEVCMRQATPSDWAMMQNNLATAYNLRIRGARADNLEQAIHHCEQALEVTTRQAYPEKWAMTQNNLGEAYRNRIRGKRGDNLERAIEHYEQALEVYTGQAYPEKWATIQNNLGEAYRNRIRGARADNLERAIAHLQQALEVYTRQAFPEKWATIQNNLGEAYSDRIRGERGENLSQAISHYEQALSVYTPQSFPQKCRDTAYGLGGLLYGEGGLLYGEGRLGEAREVFVMAHEAVEALRGEAVREGARRELAEENADLYARLVFCCLREGDEEAAFKYAAAGKGRAFADMLASARVDLFAAEVDDPALAADLRAYRAFREQIDELQVELTASQGGAGGTSADGAGDTSGRQESERVRLALLQERRLATQEKAAEHWEDMTFRYPALTACESAPALTAQDARELSAQLGATLVEYYEHAEGWCAFVVTATQVRYMALPGVTNELLEEMDGWKEALKDPAGRAVWTIEALEDWYEAVLAPLSLPHGAPHSALSESESSSESESRRLPKQAAYSTASSAGIGERVVLAPFKELGDLPLFAARDPEKERYLAERYQLAFVPSLGALHVAQKLYQQKGQQALLKLLSVAYPGTPALPNVIPEADAVTKCFGRAIQLKEKAATPQAVLQKARDERPHALHLGCHGRFNKQNPEESGLMLAGGRLTLQQIIIEMQLDECHLVALSACESWVLTQAFMSAGAPTVISSQWRVNDSATRALFEAFYAHLTNGYSSASALREATRLIRDCDGWEHPYYWAPFIVNGLAHQAMPTAQPSGCALDAIQQQVETRNRERVGEQPQMDFERLERVAHTYLNGMVSRTVRKTLTLADGNTILARLASLSQQAATVPNQRDLFALYAQIHLLAEETPVLRRQLIPKNADITQMQKDRFITKEDFNKTRGPQEADPKAVSSLQQSLTKKQSKLEAHLASLEEAQAKN